MAEPLAVLDGLMLGFAVADQNEADRAAEASTQRLAGMAARRIALRHPCTGEGCVHRNHRRDCMHAGYLQDALFESRPGLPVEADYASDIAWGSFSKDDVKLLQ